MVSNFACGLQEGLRSSWLLMNRQSKKIKTRRGIAGKNRKNRCPGDFWADSLAVGIRDIMPRLLDCPFSYVSTHIWFPASYFHTTFVFCTDVV